MAWPVGIARKTRWRCERIASLNYSHFTHHRYALTDRVPRSSSHPYLSLAFACPCACILCDVRVPRVCVHVVRVPIACLLLVCCLDICLWTRVAWTRIVDTCFLTEILTTLYLGTQSQLCSHLELRLSSCLDGPFRCGPLLKLSLASHKAEYQRRFKTNLNRLICSSLLSTLSFIVRIFCGLTRRTAFSR